MDKRTSEYIAEVSKAIEDGDGHISICQNLDKVIISHHNIQNLEGLVNLTCTLLHYAAEEYSRMMRNEEPPMDVDEALGVICHSAIESYTTKDIRDDLQDGYIE